MEIGKLASREEFSAWVPFGDAGVEILIRFISREEVFTLQRKAVQVMFDRKETTEKHDPVLGGVILGQAAILDWKGFTVEGDVYPCTPENIETLMRRWASFASFVDGTCIDMIKLQDAAREAERKNSKTSSVPGETTHK